MTEGKSGTLIQRIIKFKTVWFHWLYFADNLFWLCFIGIRWHTALQGSLPEASLGQTASLQQCYGDLNCTSGFEHTCLCVFVSISIFLLLPLCCSVQRWCMLDLCQRSSLPSGLTDLSDHTSPCLEITRGSWAHRDSYQTLTLSLHTSKYTHKCSHALKAYSQCSIWHVEPYFYHCTFVTSGRLELAGTQSCTLSHTVKEKCGWRGMTESNNHSNVISN